MEAKSKTLFKESKEDKTEKLNVVSSGVAELDIKSKVLPAEESTAKMSHAFSVEGGVKELKDNVREV